MHNWQRIILACLFLMAIVTALMMSRRSLAATLVDGYRVIATAVQPVRHQPRRAAAFLHDANSQAYPSEEAVIKTA